MTRYAVPMLTAGLLMVAGTVPLLPTCSWPPHLPPKEDDDAKKFQGTWQVRLTM